jgi:hypothetical protein
MEGWFRAVVPNPRKEAVEYMQGQADQVAMHIWDTMKDIPWPPKFESEEGNALLLSSEGQARAIHLVLRRGFADGQFTLDNARDLADDLTVEEFMAIMNAASPGEPGDPLADSTPTVTTTSQTTPTTETVSSQGPPAAA